MQSNANATMQLAASVKLLNVFRPLAGANTRSPTSMAIVNLVRDHLCIATFEGIHQFFEMQTA